MKNIIARQILYDFDKTKSLRYYLLVLSDTNNIGQVLLSDTSSVPEGKLMGVELIGVYKSGSINWG